MFEAKSAPSLASASERAPWCSLLSGLREAADGQAKDGVLESTPGGVLEEAAGNGGPTPGP